MKTLFWFCKELYIGNIIHSPKVKIKDVALEDIDVKESIMVWITVESKKDIDYFSEIELDLRFLCKRFNTKTVVIIPFAHLTNKVAGHDISFNVIELLQKYILDKGYVVKRANFGSSKDLKFFSPSDAYQVVFRSYPLTGFEENFKIKR